MPRAVGCSRRVPIVLFEAIGLVAAQSTRPVGAIRWQQRVVRAGPILAWHNGGAPWGLNSTRNLDSQGEVIMRKLVVFNQVSLDGYFVDNNGDMSWAHNTNKDEEWDAFVTANAQGGGVLVFGRITYEMMAGYWPTPQALQNDPVVAERMNLLPKVVFSRTMDKASWSNTKLVKGGLAAEIRKLKNDSAIDLAVMGSGSIVSQLTQARLIDEYRIVMIPVVLGKGRTMFEGIQEKLSLKLKSARTFGNGNVLLTYDPMV
jgi:dihydrofolate reductase